LTLDIIKEIEILALLSNERSPSEADLFSIKEVFQQEESRIPQLIFINNPSELLKEGLSFQEIIHQHEVFFKGVKETLERCINGAESNLERAPFQRMLKQFHTHLFISHIHLGNNHGKSLDFQRIFISCLEGLVQHRLKPAVDMIFTAFFELGIVLATKKKREKKPLPKWNPEFESVAEFELCVSFLKDEIVKCKADSLAHEQEVKKQIKETKDFLIDQFSTEAILEDFVNCVLDFHVSEVAHRVFTICQLSVDDNGDESNFKERKSQCQADFEDSFEDVKSLGDLSLETTVGSSCSSTYSSILNGDNFSELRNRKFGLHYKSHVEVCSCSFALKDSFDPHFSICFLFFSFL